MAEKKTEPVIHVHYVHHFHHAAPQQYHIMGPPPMQPQAGPTAQEFIMAPMAPGFFAAHYEPPKADDESSEADREEDE